MIGCPDLEGSGEGGGEWGRERNAELCTLTGSPGRQDGIRGGAPDSPPGEINQPLNLLERKEEK